MSVHVKLVLFNVPYLAVHPEVTVVLPTAPGYLGVCIFYKFVSVEFLSRLYYFGRAAVVAKFHVSHALEFFDLGVEIRGLPRL